MPAVGVVALLTFPPAVKARQPVHEPPPWKATAVLGARAWAPERPFTLAIVAQAVPGLVPLLESEPEVDT